MTANRCGCAETKVITVEIDYVQIDAVINLSTFRRETFQVPFFVQRMLVRVFEHGGPHINPYSELFKILVTIQNIVNWLVFDPNVAVQSGFQIQVGYTRAFVIALG